MGEATIGNVGVMAVLVGEVSVAIAYDEWGGVVTVVDKPCHLWRCTVQVVAESEVSLHASVIVVVGESCFGIKEPLVTVDDRVGCGA